MNALDDPRAMSERELAILGLNELAYVTQVVVDRRHAYSIHAADGTIIDVTDDRDVAFAAARQHDLEPVSVH